MTYERDFGEIWQGLLADGSVDLEFVACKYKKHYGYQIRNVTTAIVDMIAIMRRQHRSKRWCGQQSPTPGLSRCRPSIDFILQQPVCENYVLTPNRNELYRSRNSIAQDICPIILELTDAEPNRFIILALSNCKDLEKCTKAVLKELGFVEHPEQTYRNYKLFSLAALKLIEESISYFEAPCVQVLEYLKRCGLPSEQESFA